jgi:predicted transposase/invertase (TIGR01784 family)
MQEGRTKGHQEGSEDTKRIIAKKLLASGVSIDNVSQVTGLSLSFLNNIALEEEIPS